MDAFEQLVSEILWMSGFWVRTSVKVELTKEEKRLIGRQSEWRLSEAKHFHGSGTQLAHSNRPRPAFRIEGRRLNFRFTSDPGVIAWWLESNAEGGCLCGSK